MLLTCRNETVNHICYYCRAKQSFCFIRTIPSRSDFTPLLSIHSMCWNHSHYSAEHVVQCHIRINVLEQQLKQQVNLVRTINLRRLRWWHCTHTVYRFKFHSAWSILENRQKSLFLWTPSVRWVVIPKINFVEDNSEHHSL